MSLAILFCFLRAQHVSDINPLTPNDDYSGRTALLTSKVAFYVFIQQIYVLNILNMVYTLRFFLNSKCSLFHNSNVFGSCFIHILYTGCAKIYKNNSGTKTLIYPSSGACNYSVELPHWSYCSWFDVWWSFSVVGLEWYPCCRLLQPATRIPLQPNHTETPTHIETRTIRPMW